MKRAVAFKRRSSRESRRSSREKENFKPVGTKRKFNSLQREAQTHDVLCTSNGAQEVQEISALHREEGRMASEQVEALLATKILGKSKFDLKGKNEQMMDHIRKLRACIRQFLQVETTYNLRLEHIQNDLQAEKESYDASVLSAKEEKQKLLAALSEVQEICTGLERALATAEEEKRVLVSTHDKDIHALESFKKDCQKLSAEIEKLKSELKTAEEKIKSLQDINKRLSEYNTSLQDYNKQLQSDALAASQENSKTQHEKLAILETLGNVRSNATALQSQLDTMKTGMQEEIKQKAHLAQEVDHLHLDLRRTIEEREKYQSQVQALIEENNRFRDFSGKSESELETVTIKAVALEESHARQEEHIRLLTQHLEMAKVKLQTSELSIEALRNGEVEQTEKVMELQLRLVEAEQRLNEGEIIRRKLHNTIQELKGNIRVFCRVRPLLAEDEDADKSHSVVQYPQFGDLLGRGIDLVQAEGQNYAFSFDKVFGPDVTQDEVFEEISQLVQSALDGYKVCIFAYGQTGSGKTYTMLGHPDQSEHRGLIPRSLEQIFKSSQALHGQGWQFKMQASMLEIYNENIRDLLTPKVVVDNRNDSIAAMKTHAIKHDSMGNTHVSELTLVEVTSWKEVSTLLRQAAQSRAVGKTAMNEQSSRSHCVFTLRISGVNESTEQQVHGVLNLVDLAGSERLSRSGSTGDRLKETQAINKSLSCLGDVILSIANKEQHVPYRNSKLTYLLQPCLGGDSKTLMFVNIAPESKSFNESLCSLRFAAKVNACEIGVPRRQTRAPEARLSTS